MLFLHSLHTHTHSHTHQHTYPCDGIFHNAQARTRKKENHHVSQKNADIIINAINISRYVVNDYATVALCYSLIPSHIVHNYIHTNKHGPTPTQTTAHFFVSTISIKHASLRWKIKPQLSTTLSLASLSHATRTPILACYWKYNMFLGNSYLPVLKSLSYHLILYSFRSIHRILSDCVEGRYSVYPFRVFCSFFVFFSLCFFFMTFWRRACRIFDVTVLLVSQSVSDAIPGNLVQEIFWNLAWR